MSNIPSKYELQKYFFLSGQTMFNEYGQYSNSELLDLIMEAKKSFAKWLGTGKNRIINTHTEIDYVRIVRCTSEPEFIALVASYVMDANHSVYNLFRNKYTSMQQSVWKPFIEKFNIDKNEIDIRSNPINDSPSTSLSSIMDIMLCSETDMTTDIINEALNRDNENYIANKIKKYYQKTYSISNWINGYQYMKGNDTIYYILHIKDNRFVITPIHKSDESILLHPSVLNCLETASESQITEIIKKEHPEYVDFINKKIPFKKWFDVNDVDQIYEVLFASNIIKKRLFDETIKRGEHIQELAKHSEYVKARLNAILTELESKYTLYHDNRETFIVELDGSITHKTYDINISSLEIRSEIKCLDYLINNNFFDKMDCSQIIVSKKHLKLIIDSIIRGLSPCNVDISEIVFRLKESLRAESLEDNTILNDYFGILVDRKSIEFIPAWDPITDTFYPENKHLFDGVTIDLFTGTTDRIQTTCKEGAEIIKQYQKTIATYALDAIMKNQRVKKSGIPRNMFKLDDMVYIKSESFIRVWFGIKGVN